MWREQVLECGQSTVETRLHESMNRVLSGVCLTTVLMLGSVQSHAETRQYAKADLVAGSTLYSENCANCHGPDGRGPDEDWWVRDANGNYPPPPLNGTAHTWHHTAKALFKTIKNGTISLGGNMPGWEDKLTDDEILLIINWITSLWPDEIYDAWRRRH